MRLIVAEDMLMFRETVVRVCRDCGHTVVAETDRAEEALRLFRRHRPDAAVLDVRLVDGGDGLSVAATIRREAPAAKLVVITSYTTDYFIHRLAQAPVDAFVDKTAHTSEALGVALAAIAQGRKFYSPVFQRMRQQQNSDPNFFGKLLTPREQEILGLIGRSFSDREIAARLGMAARTVQDYRSILLHKLHLDGTPKLIAFALAHGFVAAG